MPIRVIYLTFDGEIYGARFTLSPRFTSSRSTTTCFGFFKRPAKPAKPSNPSHPQSVSFSLTSVRVVSVRKVLVLLLVCAETDTASDITPKSKDKIPICKTFRFLKLMLFLPVIIIDKSQGFYMRYNLKSMVTQVILM